MNLLNSTIKWVTSVVLHFSLLLLIISMCFVFLFGDKQAVKDTLVESEVYNSFLDSVIKDNLSATNGQPTSLPLDDPNIVKFADEAFSPKVLKEKSESFIDQLFLWLDGDVSELKIELDLNKEKDLFIQDVANYSALRLANLPYCEGSQIPNVTVFELDCRPQDISLQFISKNVAEDLKNTDFLADLSITEENLPKNSNGKYLHEELSFYPFINQTFIKSWPIFVLVFILSATLFVLIRKPIRRGFRILGRDLSSNGATFIVMTIIFGFVLPSATNSLNIQGSQTVTLLNDVTDTMVRRFDTVIINVAIQILFIGILILIIEKLTRGQNAYSSVKSKSGLVTSHKRRSKVSKESKKRSNPPVQTSESALKKPAKKARGAYKKSGL